MALNLEKAVIGIEFGSTNIKAVLIDENHVPVASGSHGWENQLVDGVWTYSLEAIHAGLQDCYAKLKKDAQEKCGVTLTKVAAIGFSAMMHGYMAFDKDDQLLVPFRTWRNTITGPAAAKLTELFHYNIPQRWSISHLYQAILNGEEHVKDVTYFTTLAGYIHWLLTGRKVLGVGDASGMFPIDPATKDYIPEMIEKFDALVAPKGYPWKLKDILPQVLCAGENAGALTEAGAKLLDPAGDLEAGIPLCPPEGDAGTGMTATNSVAQRTGNISAGTSVFSMIVLEKPLENVYEEIDLVTTPSGDLVAMAHCANCTSDLNAWAGIFNEFAKGIGANPNPGELYGAILNSALTADPDCGGVMTYGYFSGEHMTHFEEGRPLLVRMPDAKFNLGNFARAIVFSALGAIKIGNNILQKEGVSLDKMTGHGGLYKTKDVGQKLTAACFNAPVSVMETAGEGGAWGIALLASYMLNKAEGETLGAYLDQKVFAGMKSVTLEPDPVDVEGFNKFMERYNAALPVERAAVDSMK
ncbi:MAG: xylulokinase [Aristaeellaceae bacterium]|nr:FGGY-family carbohydrate kinase [Eubacteriales bacterium]